jgi:two-component system NtrC family sensor kinase
MAVGPRGSILVIEDDDSLQALFGKVLTQSGFHAATASSARDARPLFKQQVFDALVCDLSASGGRKVFDFVRYVREHQPHLAVLIITGFTPDDIACTATTLGLDVMEKPFSPPQLVERITLMLSRKAVA